MCSWLPPRFDGQEIFSVYEKVPVATALVLLLICSLFAVADFIIIIPLYLAQKMYRDLI